MDDDDARGTLEEPRASVALWDYRRRTAEVYAAVRGTSPQQGWDLWRKSRDSMFATHLQSPIPEADRSSFPGLHYFPYDPDARVPATLIAAPEERIALPHSGDGWTPARAFAVARFELRGVPLELTMYWLEEYGGGVFVPFGDHTNGRSTYGGGRYLLDTAKGADLGTPDTIVFDFNFSYHPSCVHDPSWSCPLSPPQNRLGASVEAGERLDRP